MKLESIRIASPCNVSWSEMAGDERVRFCGRCEKHVYNLSALSRVDAERLVAESEGERCVRFYRRADGTVLTSDCPEGVREHRSALLRFGLRAGGLGALLAGAAALPLLLASPALPTPMSRLTTAPPPIAVPIPKPGPVVGAMPIPPPRAVPVEPPRPIQGGIGAWTPPATNAIDVGPDRG